MTKCEEPAARSVDTGDGRQQPATTAATGRDCLRFAHRLSCLPAV